MHACVCGFGTVSSKFCEKMHWLALELLVAYTCSVDLAPVVLPIIALIWLLESSWLWAETSQISNEKEVFLLALGRHGVVLALGVFDLEYCSSIFLVDRSTASVVW